MSTLISADQAMLWFISILYIPCFYTKFKSKFINFSEKETRGGGRLILQKNVCVRYKI
jgi:hypothetical protein